MNIRRDNIHIAQFTGNSNNHFGSTFVKQLQSRLDYKLYTYLDNQTWRPLRVRFSNRLNGQIAGYLENQLTYKLYEN